MNKELQVAIEALTRYDDHTHDFCGSVMRECPNGLWISRAEVLDALQDASAQGSIGTPEFFTKLATLVNDPTADNERDLVTYINAQRPHVHFTLCRILQDHLIKENEYNSVEFDAIYGRKTEQEVAEEIYRRLHERVSVVEETESEPTEAMLNAARDWSVKKYGIGIGNDAAIGCWKAMHAVAPRTIEYNQNAAVAAIAFALETDQGFDWLRLWNEGEFDKCRDEWPEAPEAVYIGADPLHPLTQRK